MINFKINNRVGYMMRGKTCIGKIICLHENIADVVDIHDRYIRSIDVSCLTLVSEYASELFEDYVLGNSFKQIYEMAKRLPDLKYNNDDTLIIVVGDRERGNIPHFHIFRNRNDKKAWKNSACIMFKHNSYFDHSNHKEILKEDEFNAVIEYLKEYSTEMPGITNWQLIVLWWNEINSRYKIPEDLKMPDYDFNTITTYAEFNK